MKYTIAFISMLVLSVSCKKFVAIEAPSTQLVAATVFTNDQTAIAAQLAIYARMEGDGLAYQQQTYNGLSGDEFMNYSTGVATTDLASNNLTAENTIVLGFWSNYYKYIYQANAILESLEKSYLLSESVKKQLTGESKFVRAFCYYYLCSLFGDVPIVQSTDYRVNSQLPRNSVAEVIAFIENDLVTAIPLLSTNYLDANNAITAERVRPNKSAAQALLARVYILLNQWEKAENTATEVINGNYQLVTNPDLVFLKNSAEAIWQFQSVVPGYNSYPGAQLILTTTPTVAALDTNFIKDFAATDKRKLQWTKSITVAGKTYYYPFKYKVRQNASSITEYSMVMRLSEQYLLRAEARLKQNKLSEAHQDINHIRTRAGLVSLAGLSGSALMDSINKERRFELFAEFGDRWLNLKRTNTADLIMPVSKGANWSSTDALYPIPQSEINRNNQLTQNPGY